MAEDYLCRLGFVILARRFRVVQGEIDLVAREGPVLAFVEVRSRNDVVFGHPLASITPSKQARIVRAARAYVAHLRPPLPPMRFDAVGILWQPAAEVILVRDAFDAGGMRHGS